MTLDMDDVKIAYRLLKNHAAWYDRFKGMEYETQFAQWNDSRYAFVFRNGRVALSTCIYAVDFGEGTKSLFLAMRASSPVWHFI